MAFNGCTILAKADLGKVDSIGALTFQNCKALNTVIIRYDGICTLSNISAFNGTPIKTNDTTGFIYVPSSLVESYKSATNWATYADKIRAIEDYPDICG